MPEYKSVKLYRNSVEILFDDSLDEKGEKKHAYYLNVGGKKKRLAGSTTFCGIIDKPGLIGWAVGVTVDFLRDHMEYLRNGQVSPEEILKMAKEESNRIKKDAGDIGTAIHKWIEQYIKGEEPEMPNDDRVITGVNAFLEWVEEAKVKFIWSEKMVYSKKYGFVGTADCGLKIGKGPLKGKTLLGDVKTANDLHEEVKMQTASYKEADEEEAGKKLYDGRIVIRLSKESEDEYYERMSKKNLRSIPPYKVFEVVYLDEDPEECKRDYDAFINALSLYRWKSAAKNFKLN